MSQPENCRTDILNKNNMKTNTKKGLILIGFGIIGISIIAYLISYISRVIGLNQINYYLGFVFSIAQHIFIISGILQIFGKFNVDKYFEMNKYFKIEEDNINNQNQNIKGNINLFMKLKLYYSYIFSAIIIVFSFGIIKNVPQARNFWYVLIIPLIFVIIYFINFKKIYNCVIGFTYLRKNKILILLSVITLISIGLFNVVSNILSITEMIRKGSKLEFIGIIFYVLPIIYTYILIEVFLKLIKGEKNIVLENIEYNNFNKLGEYSQEIDITKLNINKELKVNRIAFDKYPPLLINKIEKNKAILLEYSDKENLNFIVLIKNKKEIFVKYLRKNESSELMNANLFEYYKLK